MIVILNLALWKHISFLKKLSWLMEQWPSSWALEDIFKSLRLESTWMQNLQRSIKIFNFFITIMKWQRSLKNIWSILRRSWKILNFRRSWKYFKDLLKSFKLKALKWRRWHYKKHTSIPRQLLFYHRSVLQFYETISFPFAFYIPFLLLFLSLLFWIVDLACRVGVYTPNSKFLNPEIVWSWCSLTNNGDW